MGQQWVVVDTPQTGPDIRSVGTDVSFALAAASDDDLDRVIDEALGAIARNQRADRAYVTVYSDNGTLTNSHEWVADGVPPHRDTIVGLSKADFAWSIAIAEGGEVWQCDDIDALPAQAAAERASFARFGVRSILQVPMRSADRTIGVVGFNHLHTPREWSTEAIDLVQRVGDSIGFALMRREITRDLRAARDAAERANAAKEEFLTRVSHDLRTPLHAILGFAELLDHDDLAVADRHAVQQILSSGHQLQVLVDELIDRADRAR